MHTNKIWLIFLGAVTFVVIWFCWGTADQLMHFVSLKQKLPVIDIEWEILKLDEDNYIIQADYTFENDGRTYRSHHLFDNTLFPNQWAAEYQLKEMKAQKWNAWFSPENPKTSSLVKKFPLKQVLSSVMLIGLWTYFIWLGFYVTQFRK